MEIKTNGKRNVKLPEINGKQRIVLKDINGDVVSYIKTGKNSGRITGAVPDVVYAEFEEIPLRQVNMGALNIAKTLDLTNEMNLILEKQNAIRQAFGAVLDFKAEIEDKFLKNKEQTDIALIELAEVAKNIGLINNEHYEELKATDLSQNVDIKKIYSLCRDLSSRAGFVETEIANITAILASHEHEKQTKESIGLGNVDNTSDIEKPVSVAVQMALDDKVSKEELKEFSEYIMSIKKRQNEIENGIQSLGGICANPIPIGGHEGQVLMKRSDLDGDYWWSNTAGTEPASEEKAGVAKIATLEDAKQGTDDTKIMTPLKVKSILSDEVLKLNAEIDANADAILKTRNDLQSEIDENKSQINELKITTTTIRSDLDDLGDQLSGIEEKIPATASSSNQLADKNFVNEKAKEIKESLGNVYKFKGSVDTFADLPTSGMEMGDVYNVIDTEKNYAWDGKRWDDIGGTIDLSLYAKKEDIPVKISDLINDSDFAMSEDVKNTVKLLDDEHKNILLSNGTYDGKDVEDGFVFTSPDGKLVGFDKTLNPGGDWGTSSLTGQEYVETRGLYGNGVVCIPAGGYTVNVSSDRGRTWKYYNGRSLAYYNSTLGGTNYCFNGQQFVGLNSGWLYTSTDGVNWSSKQTNAGGSTAGLAFGNGRYVTISSGVIKYSDDGLNWFAIQDSTSFSGYALQAFANGKFIAVGSSSVAISEDGENWSIHSKPSGNGRQCAGGNGIFVISDVENWSYGSRNKFFYSTDGGITWNTSYTASSRNWVGLSWCGDRFFAVSHKDNLYTYSFDGINWVEGTMPWSDYWTTVTYVNGDIIVTCGHGTNKKNVAYASFLPFYEYSLTDLSFNKAEVEEKYALKSDIPTMTSQLTNDSDFATNANVNGQIQDVRADFAEADSELQTQITGLAGTVAINQTDIVNLKAQKYGADLSYADSQLQLLDQDGNSLGSPVEISSGDTSNAANIDLSNLSATGQEILDNKLNKQMISNCITEIPQDIKLELNDVVEYYGWEYDDSKDWAVLYTKTPTIQVGTQLYNSAKEEYATIQTVNSDTSFTNPLEGTIFVRNSEYDETERKLILKAGSKVWIPYGTTEVYQVGDTDAYNHTVVDISWNGSKFFYAIETPRDYIDSDSTSGIKKFPYIKLNSEDLLLWQTDIAHSGTTYPSNEQYMFWYDTQNNVIKISADSGSSWVDEGVCSLPLGIFTTGGGTSGVLDQTFNGFGFIGRATYTLPGLTYLVPNGFNEDGTLRNTKTVTNKVSVIEKDSSINSREFVPLFLSADGYVFPRGFDYTFSKTGKTYNSFYDSSTNKLYYNGNSATYTEYADTFLGYANVDSSGRYTVIKDSTVFNPLTIRDKQTLTNLSMPSNNFVNLTLGASGSSYTMPATGWLKIDKTANDREYLYVGVFNGCAFTLSASGVQGLCATIPVKRNDIVSISYNASRQTNNFVFIYAEGSL